MRRIAGLTILALSVAFAGAAFADEGQQSGIPIPPVAAQPDLNNDNVPDQEQSRQSASDRAEADQRAEAHEKRQLDALSENEKETMKAELGPMTPENVLNTIHKDNAKEIALGQMAVQKAQSEDVREFGERLIQDHQKADENVKKTAKEVGVMLQEPQFDEKHQEKMAKLQELSGEAFDKEFLRVMDKGHTKTLFMLREAQENVSNDEVSRLIAELRPTIRQHDQIADTLRGEMEVAEGQAPELNEDFTEDLEPQASTPL